MIRTVTFDFEYNYVQYTAVCDVNFFTDDRYGEDADGGRGASRTFINSVEICYIMDEDGNHIESYGDDFRQFVEEKAEDHLDGE